MLACTYFYKFFYSYINFRYMYMCIFVVPYYSLIFFNHIFDYIQCIVNKILFKKFIYISIWFLRWLRTLWHLIWINLKIKNIYINRNTCNTKPLISFILDCIFKYCEAILVCFWIFPEKIYGNILFLFPFSKVIHKKNLSIS